MKQLFILFAIVLFVFSYKLQAQVGVNTTNPDSNAALHINDNMKGVLLPTVNSDNRNTMISNGNQVPSGMLVFDPDEKVYYFLDSDNKKWLVVNPWRVTNGDSGNSWGDIRLDSAHRNKNVYIGSGLNTKAEAKLHVAGNIYIDDSIKGKNGIRLGGNTDVLGEANISENLTIGNGPVVTGRFSRTYNFTEKKLNIGSKTQITELNNTLVNYVEASIETDKIIARKGFEGYGITPFGGIIMWSGNTDNFDDTGKGNIGTIMDGWAICNGSNGTPDLRGRFIVGAGKNQNPDTREASNPSYNIGDKGGVNNYTLIVTEMPKHDHALIMQYTNYRHGDKGNDYTPIGNIGPGALHERDGSTNFTGGNQPHENRPPYYALAYIMRVQ